MSVYGPCKNTHQNCRKLRTCSQYLKRENDVKKRRPPPPTNRKQTKKLSPNKQKIKKMESSKNRSSVFHFYGSKKMCETIIKEKICQVSQIFLQHGNMRLCITSKTISKIWTWQHLVFLRSWSVYNVHIFDKGVTWHHKWHTQIVNIGLWLSEAKNMNVTKKFNMPSSALYWYR